MQYMSIGVIGKRKRFFFFFPLQNLQSICKTLCTRQNTSLIRDNTRVMSMSCTRRKPNRVVTDFYRTSLCEFFSNGNHFQEECDLRIPLLSNNNANNACVGDLTANFQSFGQVVLRAMLYFGGLADPTRVWFGVD